MCDVRLSVYLNVLNKGDDMDQTVVNLALALSTNAVIHTLAETQNVRAKVKRLKAYIDKKPFKEMPVNIDTRAKSYGISLIMFVVFNAILFGVYSMFDVGATEAFKIIIVMLNVEFLAMAVLLDKYHVEIEQVTKKFKK